MEGSTQPTHIGHDADLAPPVYAGGMSGEAFGSVDLKAKVCHCMCA